MYAITIENEDEKTRENIINKVSMVSLLPDKTLLITSEKVKDMNIKDGNYNKIS